MFETLEKIRLNIDKTTWEPVKFGNVAREVRESVKDPATEELERIVGLEHIEAENIHLKAWGSIDNGTTFTRRFRKGQVLFGRRRAYLKKAALAEFDGLCSGDIIVMEAKDELLPKLLTFIVQNDRFFEFAVKNSAGSLSPRVKFKDLARFEFRLPPKDQQAQIAELLWAADKVVENYKWLLSRLKIFFDLSLSEVFMKPSNSFSKWQKVLLQDCCTLHPGIMKGKRYSDNDLFEIPYLRVANLQDGYLDLSEIKTLKVSRQDIEKYALLPGDVLLTEGGDFDKLGRGTVWKGEIEPCIYQNHIFCVRPKKNLILSEFLSFQTNSKYGKNYFLKCAKKTSNLASINSSQVKKFPVILPPIEQQHLIIDKFMRAQNHINLCSLNLANSQKMFTTVHFF